jgi:adenylate cyclase class IV
MHNYEVEIKVLLGTEEEKDIFMDRVANCFPEVLYSYSESQRNHYFAGGSLDALLSVFWPLVNSEEKEKLENIRDIAKNFSVRTRGTLTQTIIVVKATVNDESSSNGTARIEWEVDLAPMTIEEMDALVLSSGFTYQAKWSRARDGFELNVNTILCLDKNAGYGYLAEFERVIDDASLVEETRAELLQIIEFLGYHELDQARLARMFEHYNQNWAEYYGTENVFTVE